MGTEFFEALERKMWEAAKNRDSAAFSAVVDGGAVMVCGGYRCSGADYARIIGEFDCAEYAITGFEVVSESENSAQVHYVIETKAAMPENADLAGKFHITTTWEKRAGEWKAVFNMDSRIM